MSDGNEAKAARNIDDHSEVHDQNERRRHRWAGLVVIVVLIGTLGSVGAGAILTNIDWPNQATNWIRFVLGAILTVTGAMLVEISRRQLTRYFKNRKRDPDSRYSSALLNVVDHLSKPALFITASLAVAGFVAAMVAPPLLSLEPEPDLEPGEIKIMGAIDESSADPQATLINQWNTTNPDNPVVFVGSAGETDQQHENIVNDATKNREADVYVLDVVWMQEFIKKKYIRPIDQSRLKQNTSDFITNVLATCREREDRHTLWALPFDTNAGLMYYRSDLVDQVPQTWSGYYGEAAKETLRGVRNNDATQAKGLQSASSAQLANEEVLTVSAIEAMLAQGSNFVDANGTVLMDGAEVEFDDGAKSGLRNLAAAAHDPSLVLSGANEADEMTSTEAMKDGRVLFMRNWPVAFDDLVAHRPFPTASFGVAKLPWDSVLGGRNLAIAESTGKPRAAQALIEFLTSPSSQSIMFDIGGYAPTRHSAYIHSRRPYRTVLRDAVEGARRRPPLAHYTEFTREFRAGVQYAINNDGAIQPGLPKKLGDIIRKG